MPQKRYDIAIIGGGIIGATLARELSRWKLNIVVLDKASELPSGASRANSSIIHGGFDDKPGSIKASFCSTGNRMYHELKDELDFHLNECGSFVCAFTEKELITLEELLEQGHANSVPGVEIISGDTLRQKEPHVSPDIRAALWSPTAAIINNFEASVAFMESAQINGVELQMTTYVTGLILNEDKNEVLGLTTNQGPLYANIVINAAGVYSDEVAAWAGDQSFQIIPTKGEYFLLDKYAQDVLTSFFFSCPSKLGKGISLIPTADGNLLAGPNAVAQTDKEDVSTTTKGLDEVLKGVQRLMPDFPVHLNITNFAGIRANSDTEDFVIGALKSVRGFVNVAGIKSPGFTCAPALAVHVTKLIREELGDRVAFKPNLTFIPERRHIPRFAMLTVAERQRLIAQNPAYGQIVCRCETVTETQVVEAVHRGARTLSAIKAWTRAGAGRCQGGFCCPRVIDLLARELNIPVEQVTRHGTGSELLIGKTKDYLLKKEAHS